MTGAGLVIYNPGTGVMEDPQGIAFDAAGRIYITSQAYELAHSDRRHDRRRPGHLFPRGGRLFQSQGASPSARTVKSTSLPEARIPIVRIDNMNGDGPDDLPARTGDSGSTAQHIL